MNATPSLYDLSPLLRMMLLGMVIALGPLAWVWLRNRHAPRLPSACGCSRCSPCF